MKFTDLHHSSAVRGFIVGIAAAAVLIGTFALGESFGYHRAQFSDRFGNRFHEAFGPGPGMEDLIPGGHGAAGKIVSVALPKIVIAGPDNLEKTAVIGNDTLVRAMRDTASSTDLSVGDFVIVLGEPDANGEIDAKLVRIMPAPGASSTAPLRQ